MLHLNNVCICYGRQRVIDRLSLTLAADEILMLVGPTGCGKTSVMNAVAGLIPVASGSITLGDWTATRTEPVPPERRNVGMVFQDFALFPHLTVLENVAFRLRSKDVAIDWLERLGLSDFHNARPETLSGGQKQRVALARTLAHKPKLILLDEPLSNLDAALKGDLRWEIRSALKQAGIPALWVTHDQDEALSIGDRVGVLNAGKLAQIDHPETIFARPSSRFIARFMGEVSFLRGTLKRKLTDAATHASTPLGNLPVLLPSNLTPTSDMAVEIVIRPDDLCFANEEGVKAEVLSSCFEGPSRLYRVRLSTGQTLQLRASHEARYRTGQAVTVKCTSGVPLMAFSATA